MAHDSHAPPLLVAIDGYSLDLSLTTTLFPLFFFILFIWGDDEGGGRQGNTIYAASETTMAWVHGVQ